MCRTEARKARTGEPVGVASFIPSAESKKGSKPKTGSNKAGVADLASAKKNRAVSPGGGEYHE